MSYRKQMKRALLATVATATFAAALPAISSTTAYAQDYTTGVMRGTVQDTTGAVVAGATITISAPNGVSRTATANADGSFRITRLPIGNYTVVVSQDGFETFNAESVRVNVGGGNELTFTLNIPGSEIEEIVVSGVAVAGWDFQTTQSGVSVNVDDLMNSTPIGRDTTSIILLAPGTSQGDSAFGNLASIRGSSVAENAYYVNGFNITNFRNFTGASTVPFEFIETVDVKTGGYQAEFGRSIGGVVSTVTKSGTNEFHGNASVVYTGDHFVKDRPDTTTSYNRFDERSRTDYVFNLSGPIIEDKLFFNALYNLRDYKNVDFTSTARNVQETSSPFWALKIDFEPFSGHRFEATFFDDSSRTVNTGYDFNNLGLDASELDGSEFASEAQSEGEVLTGGQNQIYRYTGVFNDSISISGLYGIGTFERTAQSSQDANPLMYERINQTGSAYLGNWGSSFRSIGDDKREAWRIDADIYFNMAGEHHIRVGVDKEILTANELSTLSGGEYWRYNICRNADGCFGGTVAFDEEWVRNLHIDNGGAFENVQTAQYIQDSWQITDDVSVNIGLRNETFDNKNSAGESFIKVKNQLALRLGASWDVMGNGTDRLTAFYGRYHMPIAANTNIRMAGAEFFDEGFYRHDGFANRNSDDTPSGVDYADPIQYTLIGNGEIPDIATIKDENIEPLHQDEYQLGWEHSFNNGWTVGLHGTYRTLSVQIDDVGINHALFAWALENGYDDADVRNLIDPSQHSVIYVLTNPGTDMTVGTDALPGGELTTVNLTAEQLEYPKVDRSYKAVEFTFEREHDGVWGIQGSYTWSRTYGNTEGVVKSDNGQDDAGLTQDFDLVALTLNSYGPLPTHKTHRFKVWGNYVVNDNISVGGLLSVESPRKFGCLGAVPDGFYADTTRQAYESRYGDSDYWFCGGVATPRGSKLESDWVKKLDLSINIKTSLSDSIPGDLNFKVDIFNVFNSSATNDIYETGESESGPDARYGEAIGFQAPRSIRFSARYSF